MDDAIVRLIELIEKASPQLWDIAMKQVSLTIMEYQIIRWVAVAFAAGCFAFVVIAKRKARKDDEWAAPMWMGVLGTIIALVVILSYHWDILKITLNPEFYALQTLLELVK